jgi:hypothetical protein
MPDMMYICMYIRMYEMWSKQRTEAYVCMYVSQRNKYVLYLRHHIALPCDGPGRAWRDEKGALLHCMQYIFLKKKMMSERERAFHFLQNPIRLD